MDVQSALAALGPEWGFEPVIDISDEQARDQLARASVMALSFVAQSARGTGRPPVPQREIDQATSIPERFLTRWRGEADPHHVKAIDAYWISAAEHGMNASTFTARVIASTGADVAAALSGAVGALSGPLHGGAPSRVLKMLDEVEATGDAEKWVKRALDSGQRLMGFGHRVYRAEDPRARVLRRTSREIGSRRFEVAEALETRRSPSSKARRPDRVLATNVEFWSAVVLDHAEVPPACSRACSPAPAWRAGRRTSSSRSARRGSSARPRSTSGRGSGRWPRSRRRPARPGAPPRGAGSPAARGRPSPTARRWAPAGGPCAPSPRRAAPRPSR